MASYRTVAQPASPRPDPGGDAMATQEGDSRPLIHGFLRYARRSHSGSTDRTVHPAVGKRRSGLSQQDVAQHMGISTRLYQDWESGVRPIPRHRLDSLAEALGLD